MEMSKKQLLSVVVPLYNEASGLLDFHQTLTNIFLQQPQFEFEIIYCDDGSTDGTTDIVRALHEKDKSIKLISFSRNFGKENALSAGISHACGQAIIMLDGDGQHPVDLIPTFIKAWQEGGQVVIGVSKNRKSEAFFKRLGSKVFYFLINHLSSQKLMPGLTDFRLIDRSVQKAFVELKESDRVTRGLIDWLGFKRVLIEYKEKSRTQGQPGYGYRSLIKLATNSILSLTPTPLYIFGFLGVFITIGAFLLGVSIIIEQLILDDPLHWKFTGTAMLGTLILFLVGIILMSQGILSLYVSHIHSQSKGRPLYVIDYQASVGIEHEV